MRFLLREYLMLLKEDGELDTLITDLLITMGCIPMSKPQKGRQYGVDIAAIGRDKEDRKRKVFLIAVKQGNLTRSNWDSGPNSVRQSLNDIKDTYLNISLPKSLQDIPKKIIVCTNGDITQPVQPSWTQYINNNSTEDIEYSFWGINEIAEMVEENLLSEKLFPSEYQSLLRKTLAFMDLADYNLSHFYELIGKIIKDPIKQKQQVLKRLRLTRLCLNILFKWSQDIENLKPAFYASERCILECWNWLQNENLLKKTYVINEFYKLHILKREIGINLYNKLESHYNTQHSLYRYSKNRIEYSLNVWEHIGFLSIIGLTEIQEFEIRYKPESPESGLEVFEGAIIIAETLNNFIELNSPSMYPQYDEHSIEIALALNLFHKTNRKEMAKNWLRRLSVGIHDSFVIRTFFPLFRRNYDSLVDIQLGTEESEAKSSMLLTILIEWCAILDDKKIYDTIKKLISDNFNELNLQIWFPTMDTEKVLLTSDYSKDSGAVKHSVTVYEKILDYKKEILEELDLYCPEKDFAINTLGFDILGHIASRHYRSQPLPYFWRKYNRIKEEDNN